MRATAVLVFVLVSSARADTPAVKSFGPLRIAQHASTAADRSPDPFDMPTATNRVARELFIEARQLARQGKHAEACKDLTDSWDRDEAITTLYYLAMCREIDRHHAEAYRFYQEVARRADRDHDLERERVARERAASLEGKLGTIVIRFQRPIMDGTEVNIDGRPVAMAPEIHEKVDPGDVLVTAKSDDGMSTSKLITVGAQKEVIVEIPSLRDAGSYRRPSWVVVSGALILAGAIAIAAAPDVYVASVGAGAITAGFGVFLCAPRERITVAPIVTSSSGGLGVSGRF